MEWAKILYLLAEMMLTEGVGCAVVALIKLAAEGGERIKAGLLGNQCLRVGTLQKKLLGMVQSQPIDIVVERGVQRLVEVVG